MTACSLTVAPDFFVNVLRLPSICSLIIAVPAAALSSQGTPQLLVDTTTIRSYDGRSAHAELLRISVPEHRPNSTRKITIAAERLPSTAARPGNPIVFLMGGPGIPGSVMTPIPPYFTLFQRLRELGDVIILDQRGIGNSDPVLDCPFDGQLPTDAFARTNALVATIRDQVGACAARWRTKGAEPAAYNSVESADDVDELRRALGAEKIDIVAFSYGTRLALAIVQRHESHIGRVVLQGVNGPGLVVKRPAVVTRKLARLTRLLEQDSSWHGPVDMIAVAGAARKRLDRSPLVVSIADRRGGKMVQLPISRSGFDAIVALNLDDARLPALLTSVAAGDTAVLTRFVEGAWNGLNAGTVGLMARAVNCAADRPVARWRLAKRESRSAPFGSLIDNEFLTDDFCRAAGVKAGNPEFPRPLTSLVPVLMLTGALDATNPIENARDVARGFPNATILEIENVAHEALPVPAVQDVVVDFLRGTDVRGRRLSAALPHFASVQEASQPAAQRRR